MGYDWDFYRLSTYAYAFFSGTITTLSLTLIVCVIGTGLGIVIGILLTNRWIKLVLTVLVDFVRAIPPLVLILFFYYLFTKQVIGTSVDAYWVCVIAMSVNLAAFTSDIIRGAIENVPVTVTEAGLSLGMNKLQIIRFIIMPYIIRGILPAMTTLYIAMLKMSSLASIINVHEVVYTAQNVISNIARSLEAWTIVAIIYIIIVMPLAIFARKAEKKFGILRRGI